MKRLLVIGVLVFTIGATYVAFQLYDPFDFGPCDGNGPANGERAYYYENGKLKTSGKVKNCLWDGLVKEYFPSGKLKSTRLYDEGKRNGLTEYYTEDGVKWRQEDFFNGNLVQFNIVDLSDNSSFKFSHDTLRIISENQNNFVLFDRPTTMRGADEPFTSLHRGKLLVRGRHDFYVINKELRIEINLRDTLQKYIPSAYNERTDFSGNRYTFNWHRDIIRDTLHLKVYYDSDGNQSNAKVWEQAYLLK